MPSKVAHLFQAASDQLAGSMDPAVPQTQRLALLTILMPLSRRRCDILQITWHTHLQEAFHTSSYSIIWTKLYLAVFVIHKTHCEAQNKIKDSQWPSRTTLQNTKRSANWYHHLKQYIWPNGNTWLPIDDTTSGLHESLPRGGNQGAVSRDRTRTNIA